VRKLIISARRDSRKEPEDGSKDELKLLPEVNQTCLEITGDEVFINPYEVAHGDVSRKIPSFLISCI
jgi:hypothetical protein